MIRSVHRVLKYLGRTEQMALDREWTKFKPVGDMPDKRGQRSVTGECALCQEEAQLQRSHYLPAAFYRMLRAPEGGVVRIDTRRKSIVSIDQQYQKHLLCEKCEHRFKVRGEDAAIDACLKQTGSFPLAEQLGSQTPVTIGNLRLYHIGFGHTIENADKLAYFAASICWRGSIADWGDKTTSAYFGTLGKYTEDFRAYLRGESSILKCAAIDIYAVLDKRKRAAMKVMTTPHRYKDKLWQHEFQIPGMRFVVNVGQAVTDEAARRTYSPIFVDWDHELETKKLATFIRKFEVKGKLKDRL